jgi:parvulin-like peptidyl-prolyl isomerase
MSYKRLALPVFLFVFLGLAFSQTAPKSAKTAPKPAAKTATKPAVSESKPAASEKVVATANPAALFPAVVARVNGKPVLGRLLEQAIRRELAAIGNPEWKDLRKEYQAQLIYSFLQPLIGSELVYQKAADSGIKPTSAEIQAGVQTIAKTFKDEAEMNKALAAESMDKAALESDIDKRMTVSKYIEQNVTGKISVTPEELSEYYKKHTSDFQHPEMVRTRQILIQPKDQTAEQDAAARKIAEGLLARAKNGEDFAKLAKENSMDGSAADGGDIGFAAQESLTPEYGDAAFALPLGGMQLVHTDYGYHILKVTDKKKEGTATLEESKASLTEFLKRQKADEEYKKIVDKLREQAKIEYLISAGAPAE